MTTSTNATKINLKVEHGKRSCVERGAATSIQKRQSRSDVGEWSKELVARKRAQAQAPELEDGEVADDDDAEEEPPVCRFYLRNSCTWGRLCRFRHPGTSDMGNYVMFEPVQLPLPPMPPELSGMYGGNGPTGWMDYRGELDSSFDRNLYSLRQLMRQHTPQPWVEFNDLDTDPYYTQLLEQPMKEPDSVPLKCRSTPSELSWSSSSSSNDYTSTTDSDSSSSPSVGRSRKRKHIPRAPSNGRRFSSSSSSSSDSSSYGSSTHTSELSSSSMEAPRNKTQPKHSSNRRGKSRWEPSYKSIKLSRRAYLERKLKSVEREIAKRSRYLKQRK